MTLLAGLDVGVIALVVALLTPMFLNAIVQKQEKTLQKIGSFDDNKRSMMPPNFIDLLRNRVGNCVLQQIQKVSL